MTTAVADSARGVRACLVTLGGEIFAVDVERVREVVVFEEITRVPLAPPPVLGVANLRGEVLPIVDVRRLLGVASRRPQRFTKALVLATGVTVAVAIDEVLALEAFDDVLALSDAARKKYGGCAAGFLERGPAVVTLLDAVKLVDAVRPRGAAAVRPTPLESAGRGGQS